MTKRRNRRARRMKIVNRSNSNENGWSTTTILLISLVLALGGTLYWRSQRSSPTTIGSKPAKTSSHVVNTTEVASTSSEAGEESAPEQHDEFIAMDTDLAEHGQAASAAPNTNQESATR